jgi:hypothetical protein
VRIGHTISGEFYEPSAEGHTQFGHPGFVIARFATDHTARKEFKHWCKDQWKIYKKGHP